MKYTNNQTGAIATLFAGSMWTMTVYISGLQVGVEEPMFMRVGIIIAWILALLYFIVPRRPRLRWVYIFGMILSINGVITANVYPWIPDRPAGPAPAWFMFEQPLLHITFIAFNLICILCFIFSFRSFKEVRAKIRQKLAYTTNQTVALATLLSLIIWGFTTQGLEFQFGIAQAVLLILLIICVLILPLYVKRIRQAYVIGIVNLLLFIIGISATHGLREQAGIFPSLAQLPQLSTLTLSQYYGLFTVFYFISFVCIYFSYGAHKEFKETEIDDEWA